MPNDHFGLVSFAHLPTSSIEVKPPYKWSDRIAILFPNLNRALLILSINGQAIRR